MLSQFSMKQPVLFIGHGNPMNAILDNAYSQQWHKLGEQLKQNKPRLILMISAHWYIPNSLIHASQTPQMIYDMYGFPEPLYQVQYPAPGSPEDAKIWSQNWQAPPVTLDHDWGFDHGAWSVLVHLFPEADIPVLQLSIDRRQSGEWYLRFGEQLKALREDGVLIIGSGNIVHNLRRVDFQRPNGYDWAESFQYDVKKLITQREDQKLARYQDLGTAAQLSIPTPEHYVPLLYILGASDKSDAQYWFNDSCEAGSLSMSSLLLG